MNKSLISRLWDGDVSLGMTYWFYGVLLPNLIAIPTLAILAYLEESSSVSAPDMVTMYLGFSGVFMCYGVFMAVAIWRSAEKYQGRAIWAGLARLAVVLGYIYLAATLIEAYNEIASTATTYSQPPLNPGANFQDRIVQTNAELPKMIEQGVRWDSLSAEGSRLIEDYTLVDANISDLDIAYFVTELRPFLVDGACAPDFLSNLPSWINQSVFRYRDRSGILVAEIVVPFSEC